MPSLLQENHEHFRMLWVQQLLRVPRRCRQTVGLLGQGMHQHTEACATRFQIALGSLYNRFTRRVAICLLFILTAVHPLIHQFEGGALDAFLAMLAVRAFSDD